MSIEQYFSLCFYQKLYYEIALMTIHTDRILYESMHVCVCVCDANSRLTENLNRDGDLSQSFIIVRTRACPIRVYHSRPLKAATVLQMRTTSRIEMENGRSNSGLRSDIMSDDKKHL